jgi:hypothetical protein
MEDPFACFGDDSDSDSEYQQYNEVDTDYKKKQLLLEHANERIAANNNTPVTRDEDPGTIQVPINEKPENLPELPPQVEIPCSPPLYLGPMRVVKSDDIGGNRGYIATKDLKPGTLLLVENPIFEWTDEQIGSELGLVSIQAILKHEHACKIMNEIQALYPTKDNVDEIIRGKKDVNLLSQDEKIQIKDMVEIMEMIHSGKEMDATLALAKQHGIQMDDVDVYRMLLAMRYNGFGSGIYLYFAMFNHDHDANCIKFAPEKNGADPNAKAENCKTYSEVRTTKFVKRGDPLTLDYLDPRDQSHATKRWHLWDQHRFDIGDVSCIQQDTLRGMELVNNQYPPSSRDTLDRDSDTFHVEIALKELEEQQNEVKLAWSLMKSLKEEGEDVLKLFEHSKALGVATFEAIEAAQNNLLNHSHILLIRWCRLYLDVAEIVLEMGGLLSRHFSSSSFGPIGGYRIMANFVVTCHRLLPLQVKYMGSEHPDIARTNSDLANMINSMISHCPGELYNCHDCYGSFGKCQKMEAKYRKEFRRIDGYYPKDAEEKIIEYKAIIR